MPNHIHWIAVPSTEDGPRWAIGSTHERYTRRISFREKWPGYHWQGRFASFVMDEAHLLAAARYVELNPVRAGLVARAADYCHLFRPHPRFIRVSSVFDPCLIRGRSTAAKEPRMKHRSNTDCIACPSSSHHLWLNRPRTEAELAALRRSVTRGAPFGNERWQQEIAKQLGLGAFRSVFGACGFSGDCRSRARRGRGPAYSACKYRRPRSSVGRSVLTWIAFSSAGLKSARCGSRSSLCRPSSTIDWAATWASAGRSR